MIEMEKIEIEYSSLPVSHIDFVWFLSGLDECYAREEIHRIVLNGIEKMKSHGINCLCSPEESKRRQVLDEPRCSRQAAADVFALLLDREIWVVQNEIKQLSICMRRGPISKRRKLTLQSGQNRMSAQPRRSYLSTMSAFVF
jgi:hypothetical protein